MRNIITVIDQIATLLTQAPDTDQITVVKAELAVIRKQALYNPAEADNRLWTQLGNVLYRYLPQPPSAAPYLQAISDLVTQSATKV